MAHKTIALTTELRELERLGLDCNAAKAWEFVKVLGLVCTFFVHGAHGVVVSHPLSMREALGSIPSVSIFLASVGSLRLVGVFVILWMRV